MEQAVEAVFRALVRYGLNMRPSKLSEKERQYQKSIIRELLEFNDPQTLIDAIQYGMPNVWPFSDDGRAFAAADLEKNLLKAKAESGRAAREGRIAHRPRR
jgi:hypothetical protein